MSPFKSDLMRVLSERGFIHQCSDPAELDALRRAVTRSSPYGSADWVEQTAKKLHLQWTLRPRGRPRVRLAARNSAMAARAITTVCANTTFSV